MFLWLQGILIPNAFTAKSYEVKGIDVSSYQGHVNWQQIEEQDIRFAFIKSTEGSRYVAREWSST